MILRKNNIILLVTTIIAVIVLLLIILGILCFKTNMFKSNETLFAKYFIQNFDVIDILRNEDVLGIEKTLNENKYLSRLDGKVEYVENINTSVENRANPVNDVKIKIESNVDRANNYEYRDIDITDKENGLLEFEYLVQNQNCGLRLQGIQQFVSFDISNDIEILKELGLENIEQLLSKIDIDSILNFSEEEKQNLSEKYMGIIQAKITKDRYYKQPKTLITIDNNEVQTNAYYVKITIEEYNNIIIDILEQLTQEEILLSRIDLIENEIKRKYLEYDSEQSLRNHFIDIIKDKIKEIQDNNIGNDEIKIIVYENNGITVRTAIEKNIQTITVDIYDLLLNINFVELGNETKQTNIKIQKQNQDNENNILFLYEVMRNNETINKIKYKYQEKIDGSQITREAQTEIANEKNVCIIDISDAIELVNDFSDQISLDVNNIKLSELEEEKLDLVLEIISNNIKQQKNHLSSVVTFEDYKKILRSAIINTDVHSVELPDEGEVSEVQKKRFNSQFEFFVSENLTDDNIRELIEVAKNNFEDMKIYLTTEEILDLDLEQMQSNDGGTEYIDNISEILIFIKANTSNQEKKKDTLKFLEEKPNNMYNVFLQYDENGLVRLVRIQIQKER